MVCHVLLEGQGWSPDHPDQLPLLPILVLSYWRVNTKSVSGSRMFEKSTNLLSKWKGKWSGNEPEMIFLQHLFWAQVSQLTFIISYILIKVGYYL